MRRKSLPWGDIAPRRQPTRNAIPLCSFSAAVLHETAGPRLPFVVSHWKLMPIVAERWLSTEFYCQHRKFCCQSRHARAQLGPIV